jgi:RecA DNA recombination protein
MTLPSESLPPPGWGARGIDGLLGAFPPGQLSEIVGPWSSGGSSLLLALIARVTTSGGKVVAVVDGTDAFDPFSAAAAGVDLSGVLWVKCGGRLDPACRAADLLARCPGFALVVMDLGGLALRRRQPPPPPSLWLRLRRAVEGSPTILVLRAPERLAGSAAALVVSARRLETRWMGALQPTRFAALSSEFRLLRARISSHPHPNPLPPREGEGTSNPLSPLGRGQGAGGERAVWTIEWRS